MADMRKHPRIASIYSILLVAISSAKVQKKAHTFVFFARKYYFCRMKERINWIDWGKAIAVTGIVYIHLPQSQEWFYFRYLQACVITIFFFLSGYLKKDRGSTQENWKKYWHGLILPYLLYNAIIYPYWFIKYYMLHGGMPDLFHALRPIWGTLLFQHENAFCEPLNGPLWYLPAILFMHILIDLCRKTNYLHTIMITLCIVSFFLYAANKYYMFLPNLTPMGLFRSLPFYYIGYALRQRGLYLGTNSKRDLITFIGGLSLSLLLFYWHLHESKFLLHIALFYPVIICFIFGILSGCKLLDGIKSDIITNLSIGTLVIVGLHYPIVSLVNFALEHLFKIDDICYQWYEALFITLGISSLLYPVILYGKKQIPAMLGKKRK